MSLKKQIIGVVGSLAIVAIAPSVMAVEDMSGYGGDAPACTVYATPDTIEVNGGTTLNWDVNDAVVIASLHAKGSTSWMQEVSLDGSWWISGITNSRDYVLTVESADGQTADCEVRVNVTGEVSNENLTCNLVADPSSVEVDGGTSLVWSSTGEVVMAKLHPTNSTSYFADVSPSGSWWIDGIADNRSYSVTLWDEDGNMVTCDAPITVTEEVDATVGECVDWDGDGWGWDGEKGCKMDGQDNENEEELVCYDWDGDGWGWDGEKGCKM